MMTPFLTVGDPDTVGEEISGLMAAGLDGIIINLPAVGHDPEMIALAGEVCGAAIG